MLIDKNDIPQVAVASMNETHDAEIKIINELYDLITKSLAGQPVETELNAAIERFAEHVEQHFSSEEILMQQTGFPAYGVHKSEHDRVRLELSGIVGFWRQDKNVQPLANYLANVHPSWAVNHIATMDTMTAYYIAQAQNTSRVG